MSFRVVGPLLFGVLFAVAALGVPPEHQNDPNAVNSKVNRHDTGFSPTGPHPSPPSRVSYREGDNHTPPHEWRRGSVKFVTQPKNWTYCFFKLPNITRPGVLTINSTSWPPFTMVKSSVSEVPTFIEPVQSEFTE